MRSSAPLPKFVIHRGTLSHELRKQRGTSKHMILVPLFDLKFLNELAAGVVGTSNRRHFPGTRAGDRAAASRSLSLAKARIDTEQERDADHHGERRAHPGD